MDNVFARLQYGTPHGPKQPHAAAADDDDDACVHDHDHYGEDAAGGGGGGSGGHPTDHDRHDGRGYARFGATEPVCVSRGGGDSFGGGGGGGNRKKERVPRLVDLAVSALAEAFTFITRLPPLPPELINEALSRAKLDRRTLALALGAGATRLHVYDFWELCHSFPAAWHCWQDGTSAAAPPPPQRAMPAPACMVEVRDGVLQPSQYDWMRIFPLTSTLEAVSVVG